ncbi:hypothetical protein MNV49_004170 [Pseudohyphozyma bogoriensis]|nr:hypothetical protein MNV49_004170 [Pseudohyphozyma bogoriensis]
MKVARRSLVSGVGALVLGMLYGTQILDQTFGHSRLMLYTHSQLMSNGLMQSLGGLILHNPQTVSFESPKALFLVELGNVWGNWIMFGADMWGAYAHLGFPRLIREAGLPTPEASAMKVFTALHYGPAMCLLLAWTLLLYGVCTQSRSQAAKARLD